MSGETVLIVDDQPVNLKLARVVLEAAGYVVRMAVDADDALAQLASCEPQLILMDVQLPGMDGLELTRRLKRNPATRDIPVVALTAYAMAGDEAKARAAGCVGYVAKPIDTRRLADEVAAHLQVAKDAR